MRVESWMTRDPITVEESTPLREAWHVFWSRKIRHLPVVRGLVLVGVLSERDLRDRVWPRRNEPGPERFGVVRDAMTRGVITVGPGETMDRIACLMQDLGIGCVPVVAEDRVLLGIVTTHDLLRFWSRGRQAGVAAPALSDGEGPSARLMPAPMPPTATGSLGPRAEPLA